MIEFLEVVYAAIFVGIRPMQILQERIGWQSNSFSGFLNGCRYNLGTISFAYTDACIDNTMEDEANTNTQSNVRISTVDRAAVMCGMQCISKHKRNRMSRIFVLKNNLAPVSVVRTRGKIKSGAAIQSVNNCFSEWESFRNNKNISLDTANRNNKETNR